MHLLASLSSHTLHSFKMAIQMSWKIKLGRLPSKYAPESTLHSQTLSSKGLGWHNILWELFQKNKEHWLQISGGKNPRKSIYLISLEVSLSQEAKKTKDSDNRHWTVHMTHMHDNRCWTVHVTDTITEGSCPVKQFTKVEALSALDKFKTLTEDASLHGSYSLALLQETASVPLN